MPRARAHLGDQPIALTSRPDAIAAGLREAITRGQISEGEQLVEPDLATSFGTSRPTVREALQRLVQEGLLTAIPHRGVFVAAISRADVAEIYDARRAIETSAALRLAQTREPRVLNALTAQHRLMAAAARDDNSRALTEADMRFHEILVGSLNNARLERTSQTLMVETRICLARLEGQYAVPQAAVDEHLNIIRAISTGDQVAIIKTVADHMSHAAELLDELVARSTRAS